MGRVVTQPLLRRDRHTGDMCRPRDNNARGLDKSEPVLLPRIAVKVTTQAGPSDHGAQDVAYFALLCSRRKPA